MPELSNPYSTGGGGGTFETQVQSAFVSLLIAGGSVPCLPPTFQLKKIVLQARNHGYATDDFVAFAEDRGGKRTRKLLCQIKHTIAMTPKDGRFGEVLSAAWTDFHNQNLFNPDTDVIVLITGPLSISDTRDVRGLLNEARMSPSPEEFDRRMSLGIFVSDDKRNKLRAFRDQLEAIKGSGLSNSELWGFLKSYHMLGFDLDLCDGVCESLIRTIIRSNGPTSVDYLWGRIVGHVRDVNQGAGTIEMDTLPSDILDAFVVRFQKTAYFSHWQMANRSASPSELKNDLDSQAIRVALLIGQWNEDSELDRQAFERMCSEEYHESRKQLRKLVSNADSLVKLEGTTWRVVQPDILWPRVGQTLLDEDITNFRELAENALPTVEPSLQSDLIEVGTEAISRVFSSSMKAGIAETLAILGARREWLPNCNPRTVDDTARVVVRDVLRSADWRIWASLNEILSSLAEAAPAEFLDAVEQAFRAFPNPFQVILTDERARFYGEPRIYGLTWALETLAWNQEHLIRACLALAKLEELMGAQFTTGTSMEPLKRIFLPWLPRTSASKDKKAAALRSIYDEHPETGWRLLLGILPTHGRQSTSGTHLPKWRKDWVPEGWEKGVSRQEYFDLVDEYARFAVLIATRESGKLLELLDRLDNLPPNARQDFLAFLNDNKSPDLSDAVGAEIWNKLDTLVAHHRKYPDADWALPQLELASIKATADLYSPESPLLRYCRLFTAQEHRFHDGEGEFEEQQERLHKKKSEVVAEILDLGGKESLWEFMEMVESPDQVGQALADVEQTLFNEQDLKHLLIDDDKRIVVFARAYVSQRFRLHGWDWIESLQLKEWYPASCGLLFSCLPFDLSVWQRAAEFLGENESSYWTVVFPAPFQNANNIEFAVRKLLGHNRPEAAVKCFMPDIYRKRPISSELAFEALSALDEAQEIPTWLFKSELARLLKALQSSEAPPNCLADLEWKYLILLESIDEFRPLLLERKLASKPSFFCELVRAAYRGDGEPERKMSDLEVQNARRAYFLFRDWEIPPGTQIDGTFDPDHLKRWIEEVDSTSRESGHFDIAQEIVGRVLIHSPADPSGLWMHLTVASILNEEPRNVMRDGFRIALFNTRGTYLDTGGEAESELAKGYREKADAIENARCFRLATTLRDLAQGYDRDAM